MNNNREHLEHKGDNEPNKRYPSRRSWSCCAEVAVKGALTGLVIDPLGEDRLDLGSNPRPC